MAQIIQASFCRIAFYQFSEKNRIHAGNLDYQSGSPNRWLWNPSNSTPFGASHFLSSQTGGYIGNNGLDDNLFTDFGELFGVLKGFSLLGFDRELQYELQTNFGVFIGIIPPNWYGHQGLNDKNLAYFIPTVTRFC